MHADVAVHHMNHLCFRFGRTVRRYGGSTSVDTPWPDEDALDRSSLEARPVPGGMTVTPAP